MSQSNDPRWTLIGGVCAIAFVVAVFALFSGPGRDTVPHQSQIESTAPAVIGAASALGVWRGVVEFADGGSANSSWTLYSDGTFLAADGLGGSWSQSGSTVVLRYNTAAAAVYTGTITGDRVAGTFRNADDRTGTFSWTR